MPSRRVGRAAAAIACAALLLAGCGAEQPGPPPEPPPVEIPRPGEGPDPRFGFNDDFLPGAIDPELLPRSGADIVRRAVAWLGIERRPGQLNFDPIDESYEELLAAGVRPLWVLVEAPCWAAPDCPPPGRGLAPAAEHIDDFARFAARFASRYPESAGIEIFNEPNLERFFRLGGAPRFYARLFEAAATAIAEVDPEMPVITAGLSPIVDPSPGRSGWELYLRAIVDAGALEIADGVGIHVYPIDRPERDLVATTRAMLERVAELAGDLPIWVTEIGASTSGRNAVPPGRQANELLRAYRLLERRGVPVILVHRQVDLDEHEFPAELGYGVVEADGETPKPAFCALAEERGQPC